MPAGRVTAASTGCAALAAALLVPSGAALAEPYLAVRAGLACAACHGNRTGGGGRTAYGAGYGAQQLPWKKLYGVESLLDGAITPRLRLGGDLRGAYTGRLREEAPYIGEYRLSEVNVYATADLLPDRLTLYADERVAPGSATAREVFALVRPGPPGVYVKAGRFFLPFGLRLLDDDAATRRPVGFSFDQSDTGIEVGIEEGGWSGAFAVSNGTAGAPESDNGKQASFVGAYVRPRWRVGLSVSSNDLPGPRRRRAGGLFGGLRLGPVVVLAEADTVQTDEVQLPRVEARAQHAEVDLLLLEGLNLRVWTGRFDPDGDVPGDTLRQAGIGLDWTVLPGLQVRGIFRGRDGPAGLSGSRDDEATLELHVYF